MTDNSYNFSGPELRVPRSRGAALFIALWLLIMVPICIWALIAKDEWSVRIFCTVMLLFSLLAVRQLYIQLFGGPILRVDAEGILPYDEKTGIIYWSNIAEANVYDGDNSPHIVIHVKDPSTYSTRWNALEKLARKNASVPENELLIQLSSATLSTDSLREHIRYWMDKNAGRNPTWDPAFDSLPDNSALPPGKPVEISLLTKCLCIGFILIALGVMGHGLYQAYIAYTCHNWPTTTAKILSAQINNTHGDDGSSQEAVLTYSYSVDGHDYTGSGLEPASNIASRNPHGIIAHYPVGSRHTVFYNSKDPSAAYLQPVFSKRSFVGFAFGLLFLTFALFFGTIGYLSLKYGKRSPDGKYHFSLDSPVSKIALIGFLILIIEFAIAYWLGY
jgi:hypothetical protein